MEKFQGFFPLTFALAACHGDLNASQVVYLLFGVLRDRMIGTLQSFIPKEYHIQTILMAVCMAYLPALTYNICRYMRGEPIQPHQLYIHPTILK